jgi:hypothetical protein
MASVTSATHDFYVSASANTIGDEPSVCTKCKKDYISAVGFDIYCPECKIEIAKMLHDDNKEDHHEASYSEVDDNSFVNKYVNTYFLRSLIYHIKIQLFCIYAVIVLNCAIEVMWICPQQLGTTKMTALSLMASLLTRVK